MRLSVSALAMVSGAGALSTLAGCGGGGGGGGDDATPALRIVKGTLNAAELGGSGHRVVSTSDATGGSVGTGGAFSVQATGATGQLLVATDASGTGRGFAISLPGEATVVDAASTAAALIFLSPGLATSDPAEAREALSRIRSQPDWPTYLARIKAALPSGGLASLRGNASVEALRTAIALGAVSVASGASVEGRGTSPFNGSIRLTGQWGKPKGNLSGLDLSHAGLRFVRLDSEYRTAAGAPLAHALVRTTGNEGLTAMTGASVLSIGSLFTRTTGAPTTATAGLDLRTPVGVGRVKIYASGMGFGSGSEIAAFRNGLPELREAYAKTFLLIFLCPLIDVVFGGLGLLKKGGDLLEAVSTIYSNLGNKLSVDGLISAFQGGDFASIAAACTDALIAIFGTGAALVTGFGLVGAAAAAALATIGLVTAVVLVPITAANVAVALRYLGTVPLVQSIELQVSDAEVVVN